MTEYVVGKASTKTEVLRTYDIAVAQGCVQGICWVFNLLGSNSTAPYAIYTLQEWNKLR
jgi:hypothetical protein